MTDTETLETIILDDDYTWNGGYPVKVGYKKIDIDTTRRTCRDIFEIPDRKVEIVEAIVNELDMIEALDCWQIDRLEADVEHVIWGRI